MKYASNLKNLNYCDETEIKKIFKNPEFYELAIESFDFSNEDMVPAPDTNDTNAKMLYICLKIFRKIQKVRNYLFDKRSGDIDEKIDIESELDYIKNEKLVELDDLNQFKLDSIGHDFHESEVISAWKNYDIPSTMIPIEEYGTFGENLSVPTHKHILLALFGSKFYFMQICKK